MTKRIKGKGPSVPVMTRCREDELATLDLLVAGGVARSRSDALNWCVRLTDANNGEWLKNLAENVRRVEIARMRGPIV